jgi:ribosomal protein S18 acetylase RimI-like enzyme
LLYGEKQWLTERHETNSCSHRSVRRALSERTFVIQYRIFRNTDPPGLAMIWNEALPGRSGVRLRHGSLLENYVFSKPYFDPQGLIVAEEDHQFVGFVHAGFGPNQTQSALAQTDGVVSFIGVRPSYQHRGIGSELLARAEKYLIDAGAKSLYAGPMSPLCPFYFGLYGGSEMSGFVESDAEIGPFLARRGYRAIRTAFVFQRFLSQPLNLTDPRFPFLRRRFEVRIVPKTGADSWWQECVLGPVEVVDFRLEEKGTGQIAAKTSVWEMDGFSWRWNQSAVGIIDISVRDDLRRQGLGKFLLAHMLRYLQEQFFGIAEVHASEGNEPVMKLYESLGFEKVDAGHLYQKGS